MAVTLGIYYVDAVAPLGPRPVRAGPGGAGRPRQSALLLLLHRDLAAGILLRRRPADHGRDRPVPGHLRGRPRLVRLYLPADGLDRSLPSASSAASRATATPASGSTRRPGRSTRSASAAVKYVDLAGHRGRDRRRLDLLLRRRADAAARVLSPASAAPVAYITVGILTATTFVFGGFMREQVCTYMCPWPRIQGAMLDENSLIVTYNDWRGEPRSRGRKKARSPRARSVGDCIDCNACVVGLPDGHRHPRRPAARMHHLRALHRRLRRRHGQGRPARGLIAYSTLRDISTWHVADGGRRAAGRGRDRHGNWSVGTSSPRSSARARSIYLGALVADRRRHADRPRSPATASTSTSCPTAIPLFVDAFRRLDPQRLHAQAPQHDAASRAEFTVAIEGLPGASLWLADRQDSGATLAEVSVDADRLREIKVFVTPAGGRRPAGGPRASGSRSPDSGGETDSENSDFLRPEGLMMRSHPPRRSEPASPAGICWRSSAPSSASIIAVNVVLAVSPRPAPVRGLSSRTATSRASTTTSSSPQRASRSSAAGAAS